VYFYDVKIQTNIKQNLVKKYTEKSQMFEKKFEIFFLDLSSPVNSGDGATKKKKKKEEGR
jgi:hypothetical protein